MKETRKVIYKKPIMADENRMLKAERATYDKLGLILEQINELVSVQRKRLMTGVQALRSLRSALACSCRTTCVRCTLLIRGHGTPL